jgi:CspA family cold shock protein
MAGRLAVPKTGVIIWFDLNGGYGFVKPDDGGPDIFARLSVKQTVVLEAGERVSYEFLTSGKPAKTEAVIIAKSA